MKRSTRTVLIAVAITTTIYLLLLLNTKFLWFSNDIPHGIEELESIARCVQLPSESICMQLYPFAFNRKLNRNTARGIPINAAVKGFTVGFATQSSANRLFRLKSLVMSELPSMAQQSKLSKHSISLSVVFYTQNLKKDWDLINEQIYRDENICSDLVWCMNNIMIHFVYKEQFLPYPINFLRNTALVYSRANWIMIYDIDFIVSSNVISDLKDTIDSKPSIASEQSLFVVPVFEFDDDKTNNDCDGVMSETIGIECNYGIPKSKIDILAAWDQKVVDPFHFSFWQQGQRSTNYPKWRASTTAYSIGHETYFEPYVFFSRRTYMDKFEDGALCDERFYNRGFNKVNCYDELKWKLCLAPLVLPNSFMVHFYEERKKKKGSMFLPFMSEGSNLYHKLLASYKSNKCKV